MFAIIIVCNFICVLMFHKSSSPPLRIYKLLGYFKEVQKPSQYEFLIINDEKKIRPILHKLVWSKSCFLDKFIIG